MNSSESQADILLHRLSWAYDIHQEDNYNLHNRMCKQDFEKTLFKKMYMKKI